MANEPTVANTKLFVFYQFWVYLIMVGWVFYGTSFILEDDIKNCGDTTDLIFPGVSMHVEFLVISTTVLIFLSYGLFFYILFRIMLGILTYRTYLSWCKYDENQQNMIKEKEN